MPPKELSDFSVDDCLGDLPSINSPAYTRVAMRALTVALTIALICSCGIDTGAKLTNHSDQPCADKVALALNSSQVVSGAWACFDPYLKGIWQGLGVHSDTDLANWLNPAKFMETVKFLAHRALYDSPPFNTAHLLYRMEGNPNGRHITGYTDIEIDSDSALAHSEDAAYGSPDGDLICSGLPSWHDPPTS